MIGEDCGMSIKICTVYFEGKYTKDYVSKLYDGLKRHCTLPFEFMCYSDTKDVKADTIIPIPEYTPIKQHWHKLSFFSPLFANQKPGDEIIVMDIDQIILSNIDDIIGYPVNDNEMISYEKWWGTTAPRLNGGFYKFKSGECKAVWDTYIKAPEDWQLSYFKRMIVHHKYFGEQNFVEHIIDKNNINLKLIPGEWIGKITNDEDQNLKNNVDYCKKFNKDYMVLDKPNPSLKVIHFANPNTDIHNSNFSWIKDYWK